MSTRTESAPRKAAIYTVLTVVSVLFVVPLLWLLSIAFKNAGELSSAAWLPHSLRWANFHDALTLIPFGRYALTSLLLATVQGALATLSSAMVGFGFARLRARGKRPLFLVVVATLMLPQIVTLIPTYLIFARIHLIYTYWPWVLWGLGGSAFLIFLFRQTFTSMPMDLEDRRLRLLPDLRHDLPAPGQGGHGRRVHPVVHRGLGRLHRAVTLPQPGPDDARGRPEQRLPDQCRNPAQQRAGRRGDPLHPPRTAALRGRAAGLHRRIHDLRVEIAARSRAFRGPPIAVERWALASSRARGDRSLPIRRRRQRQMAGLPVPG